MQIEEGVIHPKSKAEVDNTLRDLYNSLYPKKAEFINCFRYSFKIIPSLKTS